MQRNKTVFRASFPSLLRQCAGEHRRPQNHLAQPLIILNAIRSDQHPILTRPTIHDERCGAWNASWSCSDRSRTISESLQTPKTAVPAALDAMLVALETARDADVRPAGSVMAGDTGVQLGWRLRSLNTQPGHPNCIEPGKLPRITLTPTMALKDGRPVLAITVAEA